MLQKGKRRGIALCCALVLMLMTTGCGMVESVIKENLLGRDDTEVTTDTDTELTADADTKADAEVADEADTTAQTGVSEEEINSELYNTYIEINNQMVGRFDDVLVSYFEYVDFQEEFVVLEEDYWCLSNISTFYDYMDYANELLDYKSEMDALDEAYLDLYPIMEELAITLDAVAQYTDLKSYVDDDYARGEVYHAVIWEAYAQYEYLSDIFYNELDKVAAVQQKEDMENMKAEGYVATYSIMKLLTTAQEIQDAIYAQGVDDYNLIELDTEALQPLYDQYVEEVQICLGYLADEDLMYEEGFPVNSAYFSTFDDAVGESKVALTELFQRVERQEPVDEFYLDSFFADDGTIAKFDETVSEIINDYNKMLSY